MGEYEPLLLQHDQKNYTSPSQQGVNIVGSSRIPPFFFPSDTITAGQKALEKMNLLLDLF